MAAPFVADLPHMVALNIAILLLFSPFLSFFSLAYPKINTKIGAKKSITKVGSVGPYLRSSIFFLFS